MQRKIAKHKELRVKQISPPASNSTFTTMAAEPLSPSLLHPQGAIDPEGCVIVSSWTKVDCYFVFDAVVTAGDNAVEDDVIEFIDDYGQQVISEYICDGIVVSVEIRSYPDIPRRFRLVFFFIEREQIEEYEASVIFPATPAA